MNYSFLADLLVIMCLMICLTHLHTKLAATPMAQTKKDRAAEGNCQRQD